MIFNAKYPSINEDTWIIGLRFAVFQKEMRIKLEIESFRLSVTQFSVISTESMVPLKDKNLMLIYCKYQLFGINIYH